jgi:predicted component of type VI protein secretion system
MVQLQILSGRRAGVIYESAHFPLTVGRSEQADIALDDPGVWPFHCQIHWRKEGLVLEVDPEAMASVNGTPSPRTVLRNGDVLTLGGAVLRFTLSPMKQKSLALREGLTWIALAALCLAQAALVYSIAR